MSKYTPGYIKLYNSGELKRRAGVLGEMLKVRHLVMPNNIAGISAVLKFIADEISLDTVVNIMAQYYPAYKAGDFPELARRIRGEEFAGAVQIAQDLGLRRISAS